MDGVRIISTDDDAVYSSMVGINTYDFVIDGTIAADGNGISMWSSAVADYDFTIGSSGSIRGIDGSAINAISTTFSTAVATLSNAGELTSANSVAAYFAKFETIFAENSGKIASQKTLSTYSSAIVFDQSENVSLANSGQILSMGMFEGNLARIPDVAASPCSTPRWRRPSSLTTVAMSGESITRSTRMPF